MKNLKVNKSVNFVLAICLQKIGETEIKQIIRLKQIIKVLILRHLLKIISMDISSGNDKKTINIDFIILDC